MKQDLSQFAEPAVELRPTAATSLGVYRSLFPPCVSVPRALPSGVPGSISLDLGVVLLSLAVTPFEVRSAVPTGIERWLISLVRLSMDPAVFGELTSRPPVALAVVVFSMPEDLGIGEFAELDPVRSAVPEVL